jgi:hypothetical protein
MPRASESPFAVLELRRCQEQLVAATQYIEELEFVEKMRGGETFRLPGGLLKTLR